MLAALIQTQVWDSDIRKNLDNLTNIVNCLPDHVNWVILPEMFLTGFDFSVFKHGDVEAFVQESQALGLDFLQRLAKQKSCAAEGSVLCQADYAACGKEHSAGGKEKKYRNRHYFVTQQDEWFCDKQSLFSLSDEAKYLERGKEAAIAQYMGWKINLKTCYDVRFPEICRNEYIDNQFNYDIMTFVASWPQSRSKQWKTLLQARAIENMCYVVGVNRQGVDSSDIQYSGDSCVINCKGEFLQELNQADIKGCRENKFIHYYNIDKDDLDRQRKKFPVYSDWQSV